MSANTENENQPPDNQKMGSIGEDISKSSNERQRVDPLKNIESKILLLIFYAFYIQQCVHH